jgi:Leucine-rich repeat (LRR) protein
MRRVQKWLDELNKYYTLEELKNLKSLTLDHKKITQLPNMFCKIKTLKFLSLHSTQISSLPTNFGDLNNLIFLELSRTKITHLPQSICNLTKLKLFYFDNNELLVRKNNKQMIDFLDKHKVSYVLVEDTLLTDILI